MGDAGMSVPPPDEKSGIEKQYEKFKDNWDPDKELAKQAKKDEKRELAHQKATLNAMNDVYSGLQNMVVAIQARTAELHEVQKGIKYSEEVIKEAVVQLESEISATKEWWNSQTDLMNKQMAMMAAMGFELEL